jgi:hypothetical protein
MTIQKIITHKCIGYQKGIKHVFEYVDDNRKVDIKTTAKIICKIKKRLEFYSKSTNEEIKKYLFFWNKWLKYDLVPDGSDISFKTTTYQYFVKKNYELLEDGKLLNHNQALFLLLGLNAYALGKTIKNFPKLDCDEEPFHLAEMELWRTDQNQVLRTSAFVDGGKITSENLLKLADKYDFFTKQDERLQNRNIAKKVAEKLHRLLKEANYITGKFNEIWQWEANRNQLSYLAKQLSQKRILKGECHKELANYIQDPSKAKRPLGNIKAPANTEAIDGIIKQLIT